MWEYTHYDELYHYGILGMKWGVRRTDAQLARAEKKDIKWAKKNHDKIYKRAYKSSEKELKEYVNNELSKSGKVGKNLINDYNKKLAEVMNTKISDIKAPSGKVVRFIAKRGDIGVHMALADMGYDMSQVRNGVYSSGKIAYKKQTVTTA